MGVLGGNRNSVTDDNEQHGTHNGKCSLLELETPCDNDENPDTGNDEGGYSSQLGLHNG